MLKLAASVLVLALVATAVVPRLDAMTAPSAAPGTVSAVNETTAPKKRAGAALGDVVIEADRDGHYRVNARVNGASVLFLADTGATVVALRQSEANRMGLHPAPGDFTVPVQTANGVVQGAPVSVPEISVGRIRVGSVPGLVLPDAVLATNLLGMSFLGKLDSFQVVGGRLILSD
ncbi:retropepsin-like aspartic protease family protein [Chthonobacter albigriseus]|uniref:retropepsin-like aspartic protease family protein n=1 Tax=Chthonobacter albigriseus TaxID=1683161 RepID=UPI0015EF6AC4|nr:TIGR02281 family clan AA aspartic protease [Chthonobacter albigriseus]